MARRKYNLGDIVEPKGYKKWHGPGMVVGFEGERWRHKVVLLYCVLHWIDGVARWYRVQQLEKHNGTEESIPF